MYDVITFGSATKDVFASTEAEHITISSSKGKEELRAYPTGEKILVKELHFDIGGGGTNTAVALSRLGLKVAYAGALGNDEDGEHIIQYLEKEDIDFLGNRIKVRTNYSVVLDSVGDDRTILAYKGASDRYDPKNMKTLQAKWYYCSALMGKSYKSMIRLAKHAKKNNIKVAFNPSSYLAEKGLAHLKPMLKMTDLLVLNSHEAELIVGKDKPFEMLKKLRRQGPNTVVITDGNDPIHVYHEGHLYHANPQRGKVVETTGAGDAFAASFLAGLILTQDIRRSIQYGMANSESVIQHFGAKNKLLKLKELESKIRKNRYAVKQI